MVLALAAVLVTGCGGEAGGGDPPAAEGPAKAVADTVEAFERATRRRDYDLICSELFSRVVRRQSGGRDCPELLARRARSVRDARIELRAIEVKGSRAEARVITTARGQRAVKETIELVLERGRWRIAALGG